MKLNQQLLKAVQTKVIEIATANGTLLSEEFESREDFAKFIIALTIQSLVEHCEFEFTAAFDAVMGDGSFQQLADDTWNELQPA